MKLLVVLTLAAAALAAYLWWRARRSDHSAAKVTCPLGIKDGDVVTIAGRDHLVIGTVHHTEDGYHWFEHLLEDDTRRWISVEADEGELEIVLWHPAEGLERTDQLPGSRVTVDGTTYSSDELGTSRFNATGATGLPATGTAHYADYANGSKRLSYERYTANGLWEPALGTVLACSEITVWSRPAEDA